MADGSEPGRNLPAPYQDPFAALGRDLRAALATVRLRLRELWRRNRQGDLAVPGFWPRDLAPLFWPLLLALAVAALVLVARGALPGETTQPAGTTQQDGPIAAEAPALAGPEAAPATQPEPAAQPEPPPQLEQPAPALVLDPLIELLAAGDPRHLIATATPQPLAGSLTLELTSGFARLAEPERRREADHWLALSRELGYERLLLLDGSGRALGRQALVGSGMILLDPRPAS